MNFARALPRLAAVAVLPLALAACAERGNVRADAASAGIVIPDEDNASASSRAADATGQPVAAAVVGNATTTSAAGDAVAAAPESTPSATGAGTTEPPPRQAQATLSAKAAAAGSIDADYQALYGSTEGVNGGAAEHGDVQPWDPWEKFNRRMHDINNAADRVLIHPVALTYAQVVPRPVRTGVGNFFRNLGGPSNILNSLLQGRPSQAGGSLFRFLVNSTFGVAGVFDVATVMHIPDKNNDFGRTFATWGWKNSRYLELPVFGPRTVRDAVGFAADMPLTPLRASQSLTGQIALRTITVIDIRAQLLSTDALRQGAVDDYRLLRDAWWQRRNYQLWGDNVDGASQLPGYLQPAPEPMKATRPD